MLRRQNRWFIKWARIIKLFVQDTAEFESGVEIAGDLSVAGDAGITGDLTVGGTADITGAITNAGGLLVGDGTDNLTVDSAGHLTLNGEATVWDDLRIAATSARVGPAGGPDFAQFLDDGGASTGVFTFFFDKTTEEQIHFAVQLPHAWNEGSDIYPHVHWSPIDTDTGTVIWGLEYTWANINATIGNTTIVTATQAGSGTAYDHQLAPFAAIDGTGKEHSSMLVCRLFRQAGSDTYDNDAALLEFDLHFEINQLGDDERPGS